MSVTDLKEDLEEVIRQYEAGALSTELADQYGVVNQTVINHLRKAGVKIRPKGLGHKGYPNQKLTAEQEQEVLRLYREHVAVKEIAKAVGISVPGLRHVLHRHNEPPRGRPRKERLKNTGGYYMRWLPEDHVFASMRNKVGYVLEHRLVVAESLGRALTDQETVHHKNGDRTDNRPANLELHLGRHGAGQCYECADCGSRNIKAVELLR